MMVALHVQVILENKGDIEAEFSLLPPDSLFGPKFTFSPSAGQLAPGKLLAIQVHLWLIFCVHIILVAAKELTLVLHLPLLLLSCDLDFILLL